MKRMWTPRSFVALVVLALASVTPTPAHAATVSFDHSVVISTADALDAPLAFTGAKLVQAVNFGATGQTVTTSSQTINFVQGSISTGNPGGTTTSLFRSGSEQNNALFTGDTGSAGLNAILRSQGWARSGSSTLPQTLRIGGLTAGQIYVAQLLASDQRATSASRTQRYNDAANYSGDQSDSFSVSQPTYVLAVFTADASGFQDIFLEDTRGLAGTWDTTLAGFTLYSVPTPAALPAGVGLLSILALRRRR